MKKFFKKINRYLKSDYFLLGIFVTIYFVMESSKEDFSILTLLISISVGLVASVILAHIWPFIVFMAIVLGSTEYLIFYLIYGGLYFYRKKNREKEEANTYISDNYDIQENNYIQKEENKEIILTDLKGNKIYSYQLDLLANNVSIPFPQRKIRFFSSIPLPLGLIFFQNCPHCMIGKVRLSHTDNLIYRTYLLICDRCGAISAGPFKFEKGDKYAFYFPNSSAKYHEQLLYYHEWENISNGGLSDIDAAIEYEKLPIVYNMKFPIITDNDEAIHYFGNAQFAEERSFRKSTSQGTSIRLMKGVYVRTGSSIAQSYQTIKTIDSGTLILTSKKLIFVGRFRSYDYSLKKIRTLERYPDAIMVNGGRFRKNHFYYLIDSEYWYAFVRTAISKTR